MSLVVIRINSYRIIHIINFLNRSNTWIALGPGWSAGFGSPRSPRNHFIRAHFESTYLRDSSRTPHNDNHEFPTA